MFLYKNQLQMDETLYYKPESLQLLKGTMSLIVIGTNFVERIPMVTQEIIMRINKWDYMNQTVSTQWRNHQQNEEAAYKMRKNIYLHIKQKINT